MPIAPTTSTATETTCPVPGRLDLPSFGRWRRSAGRVGVLPCTTRSLILHPRSADSELDQGRHEDHGEQGHGDGRGVTHVEVVEGLLSDVHHHAAARVA